MLPLSATVAPATLTGTALCAEDEAAARAMLQSVPGAVHSPPTPPPTPARRRNLRQWFRPCSALSFSCAGAASAVLLVVRPPQPRPQAAFGASASATSATSAASTGVGGAAWSAGAVAPSLLLASLTGDATPTLGGGDSVAGGDTAAGGGALHQDEAGRKCSRRRARPRPWRPSASSAAIGWSAACGAGTQQRAERSAARERRPPPPPHADDSGEARPDEGGAPKQVLSRTPAAKTRSSSAM